LHTSIQKVIFQNSALFSPKADYVLYVYHGTTQNNYYFLVGTSKLWERIIEHRLRGVANVTENQFGFMLGRSTMETIFLIRQLMKRCREQKKDLHMIFIDLKKTYDKVPRNIMW
jgi:hypothetical protein